MKPFFVGILSLFLTNSAFAGANCPYAAKVVDMCGPYVGVHDTLSSVDYKALGEVGPGVAKEVTSFTSVLALAKSVWFFKPTLSQLRSKYFLPALKVIAQMKALKTADRSNRKAYLETTEEVYVNVILTSLDTSMKTYKIAPELVGTAQKMAFAFILSSMADTTPKASSLPKWLSLLLGKFTTITSDIVFNNSKTPFAYRMDRLIAMEADLQNAVELSCEETPNDDDCKM